MSRISATDDEEGWVGECRNCGGPTVSRNFCSDACHEAFYDNQVTHRPPHANPNCPVCSGAGACQLCEDNAWG